MQVGAHRLGNVLEVLRAKIADLEIEPTLDLTVGFFGEADAARSQMPSIGAAMLTPSPIRSPSLSSTTSPTWTPTRNSRRFSGATPALRSTIALCTSMAQRTASTTLRNSIMRRRRWLNDAAAMDRDSRIDEVARSARTAPKSGPRRLRQAGYSRPCPRPVSPRLPGFAHCAPQAAGRLAQMPARRAANGRVARRPRVCRSTPVTCGDTGRRRRRRLPLGDDIPSSPQVPDS